jgi:Spy/CpxP family protein refolding chaperone
MRHILTFGAFLVALTLIGFSASPAQRGGDRGAQLMERLKKDLALSDSQAAKIDSLLKVQRAQISDLRDKYGDDREGMMEEMRGVREKTNTAIEALLTDEQVTKYRKIREEMRSNYRGGQRPPGQ